MAHYLIIGQGRIGKALTKQLADIAFTRGQMDTITTVARSHHQYDDQRIRFLQKDARALTVDDIKDATQIAIIITPSRSQSAYEGRSTAKDYQDSYLAVCQRLVSLAAQCDDQWHHKLRQVLFVSSTAVYGENGGEYIDEHHQAIPTTDTAMVLRQAEILLQHCFLDKAVIVRVGGIYHSDSVRLIHQAANAHLIGVPSHHYTNRIMDTDLVTVLAQILCLETPKPIYLVTDGVAATSFQVMAFIAEQMHYPPPKRLDTAASGKRICPNIDPAWLTFTDYQAGYQAVITKYQADRKL